MDKISIDAVPVFPTRFNKHKVISNPGDRFAPVYEVEYDDEGRLVFEAVAKKDIHAEIQTWKESCDVKTIIERYMAGDSEALNRVEGFFMDITDYPTDYRGVLNLNVKTKQFFESLPIEVKKEFGNSYEQFMVSLGSKEFDERIQNAMSPTKSGVHSDISGVVPSGSDDIQVDAKKD